MAFRIITAAVLGLSAVTFFSCENFLNSSEMRKTMESEVAYAKAPFVSIQIFAAPDEKYSIIPAEGIYGKTYKAGDKVDLDFTARSSYQFVKWVCEPAGSVEFIDPKNPRTSALIMKDDCQIKIQPETEKRATISFMPSGMEENARNVPVVITFSRAMDFVTEDLKRIEISSGGESLMDNYEEALLSEDRTIITFKPKRENLIAVENTRTINVKVPADFYFLSEDGTKIALEKEEAHSFKINRKTLDRAKIKLGDVSKGVLTGAVKDDFYNLDEEINLSFVPEEDYEIKGWSFRTRDSVELSETDVSLLMTVNISDDKKELSAKLLFGIDDDEFITISPVCVERNKLKVVFNSEAGTMTPANGTENAYFLGDSFEAAFKVPETYEFLGWKVYDAASGEAVDDAVTIEEKNESGAMTKVAVFTVLDDTLNVKIVPECRKKTVLTVDFFASYGSTIPAERKYLYSGDTFNLRYSEDGDYAFTGWKIIDTATGLEANDVLEFDGNGKDVIVTVKKTSMGVKIIAESKERPVVMDFAPGYKSEGVYIDSVLKFIFNKAMDESSIYWTEEELAVKDIKSAGYDLYPAEVDGKTIKNAADEPLYYAYKEKGDENGSSLVYKNFTINVRGTTENLLAHYGCPYFDVTKSILNVPVNQSNLPPKITEIEFKISKDMVSSEGISLKSSFQKFYFTGATTDNDPPDFVNLEVEQLLENGSWTKVEKKDNVDHTKPNNFKLLNIGAKNLKVKVKGVVTDTGSKPAKLKVFLNPLYTDYYDGQQKIEVGEKSLPSAGAIAEFPEGIEFDFSGKVIPQGIYLLSVAAVDNAGKEKVESFKMVYDYTPPEVSELTYVSTYAQDRLTVGRRNDTRDIYKTEITGFKDNSIKTVTRDENIELIGLAGAAPSRTHTITLKEYDYLGNYATYTKVVQAIPEPGMYYFSDDYWTKDSSRRYTTVIGAGGYEFNRETILWGIITSQGFGKNKDEYTNVKVLAFNSGWMYFYGPRNIAPWDDNEMSSSDGLKALKYVIENHDYQKLRDATYQSNVRYISLWSQCNYEMKIYVPGASELSEIFSADKNLFNAALEAYTPGITDAYLIRENDWYFSSTPYYNTTYGGTDGREWFWCVYSGSEYKAGMMKKDKSGGTVHSELIKKRGVQTLTGAYLKLVRQVDFD